MLYWFQLWREFKLSIAEIFSVFPWVDVIYSAKSIMIVDNLEKEEILRKSNNLWWTIKIFELKLLSDKNDILENIWNIWSNFESKFNYWLSIFWETNLKLDKLLIDTKRYLKNENISSRYVNKNDSNLSSAQIIWNSLVKKWVDLNVVDLNQVFYFGKTIWVQDIDAYSARDYGKSRDMIIWMLPPKLSQMMINISRNDWEKIYNLYDPFVWLGTVLIEWAYMGINNLFWSDYNPKMVQASKSNLWNLKAKLSDFDYKIIEADARDINENQILLNTKIDSIVSEWFLWEIMTQKNISMDRIDIQRKNLSKLYSKFFSWLKEVKYDWVIVISFPFWDMKWKYHFFDEIYGILDEYCEVLQLFPTWFDFKETKTWSLLYKRDKQLVWREIFKLKMK